MARARAHARKPPPEPIPTIPAPEAEAPPRTRSEWWHYPVLYLAIFAALLLIYQPVLHGGVLWDDEAHLTRLALRPLGGLWRIWFELGATQQYYPVVHSTFWLMAHVVGDGTLGYHILNVALHAASAVLVVAILRTLGVPGAIFAGVLFAVHPVHVESVAWMTELKNTLSGVFCLSALLVYLRFDATRRVWPYALSLLLFLLALLSKSVTATLPVILLVIFWLRRGRVDVRRDVIPLVPFLGLGIVMGLMTTWVERTFIGATGTVYELSLIERCLLAGRAICFYLGKLLWPSNLIFIYPRWTPDDTVWWQYLFPLAVLAALAVLWRIRGWSRAPFAALLMYCLTLGPALGFVNVFPFKYSYVADHFQYLATLPILAFCAASVFWLLQGRFSPALISSIAILLVASPLALLTRAQSREYSDAQTLYRATIAKNPRAWLAYNNLAMISLSGNPTAEDYTRALADFQTALAITPNEPLVHFNVGTALYKLDRTEEAIEHLRAAVAAEPEYADAWGNIGAALQKLGRLTEALDPYRRALSLKPSADWIRYNISAILLQLDRPEEAAKEVASASTTAESVQHRLVLAETFLTRGQFRQAADEYHRALAVGQLPPGALNHLGYALLRDGRAAEAEQYFRLSIAMKGSESAAYSNLGNALQQLGRLQEALTAYRSALATPEGKVQPETHNDFGVALARAGHLDEAIQQFREAVRLDPTYSAAQDNLAKAMRSKGAG